MRTPILLPSDRWMATWTLCAPLLVMLPGFRALSARAAEPKYEVILSLSGATGGGPCALIEGSDDRLYGAATSGGDKGEGVVFRVSKNGSGYSVLHHFTGLSANDDGSKPQGLIEGGDGTLYGTTADGGARGGVLDAAGISQTGNGTVFKLNKDGSGYTVLRRFTGSNGDGSQPAGGVVEGSDSAFFGTTLEDGRDHLGVFGSGHGTVFRLAKDGRNYQILHTFGITPLDGHAPFTGLLADRNGTLYGTTSNGGAANGRNGTVFTLKSDGSGYKVMHSFQKTAPTDVSRERRLLEGRSGGLFGTTEVGGTNDYGTVYRLSKDGSAYKVLHSFTGSGDTGDGAGPCGLIEGKNGALYGATRYHGPKGGGTVFTLNADGSRFAVLHTFQNNDSGGFEPETLLEAKDGVLYGTTLQGGDQGGGAIFKLSRPAASTR